jgi:4-hydroxy-3-methylbut-2-en-1-yl diphosphate reductase
VHITNELIHNPEVNDNLSNMNVQFIEKLEGGKKNFDTIGEGDVVILPAFGASFEEMDMLDKKVSIFNLVALSIQYVPLTIHAYYRTSKSSTPPVHGSARFGIRLIPTKRRA